MTHQVRTLEGTELVEVYDGDNPVAGPFTSDEAEAWVEAQAKPKRRTTRRSEPEPEPFEPVGIL